MKTRSKKQTLVLVLIFLFCLLFVLSDLSLSSLDDQDINSSLPCFKNVDPDDSDFIPEEKEQIAELLFNAIRVSTPPLFIVRDQPSFYRSAISSTSVVLRC